MDFITEKINNCVLGKFHIIFCGQAGFVFVNNAGEKLGYDLYLSDKVESDENSIGYKRLLPRIIEPSNLTLDFIVASHFHLDHFDYDSMSELMNGDKTTLYCPKDCNSYIEKLGLKKEQIRIISSNSKIKAGDFSLSFVSCDHGTLAPDAVGAVIECDKKRIYIVGDSCLRLDYANKIKKLGKINILIAPINGAFGNLTEKDAVELVSFLKPRAVIPCHFGMFADHGGNPGIFLKLMKEKNPDVEVMLMQYGEHVVL